MTDALAPTAAPPDDARAEYRPIADYGLLADCTTAALVATSGSIDWLCLPHYDSPAVFARILDPGAGHWSIAPTGEATVTRRHLPGSLVVETTFTTDTGTVRLTDALAFAPGQRGHDLGKDAPHEVLRLVEGVSGEVELRSELAPRPEYGLVRPLFRMEGDGGRTFGGPNRIAVRAGVPVEVHDATMTATFRVAAGETFGFSLRWAAPDDPAPEATAPADVAARVADVAEGWRSWEAEHDVYEGPNRDLVRFSARVLKGLTYRPTGAIVAAPTAGLPETEGGERNWDYRYAWVRDASLTVQALYIGSCSDEAEEFVSFMTSRPEAASTRSCRSCTGSTAATTSPSASSATSAAGATRARCASATAHGTRRSSTSTASCSTRSPLRRAPRRPASRDPALHRRPRRRRGPALGGPRRRHVGDARRAAAPPVLQGDVLGRRWTGGAPGAEARRARARRRVGARARPHPRGDPPPWLERAPRRVRAGVRERPARRRRAAHAARGLPARDRPAHARDDRPDRRRAHRGRARPALPQRGRPQRRRAARRGGHVRPVLVLARVLPGAGGRDRPRAGAVRPADRLRRTTSGCSPRRSTPARESSSATSPRRSATSA